MGHSLGLSDSYYRPTEEEILNDYLKATESLTLVRDNLALKREMTELKEKNRDEYSSLESRIREREQEIIVLREAVLEMQNLLKYPKQVSELSIENP
jgi:phosphoketolase